MSVKQALVSRSKYLTETHSIYTHCEYRKHVNQAFVVQHTAIHSGIAVAEKITAPLQWNFEMRFKCCEPGTADQRLG